MLLEIHPTNPQGRKIEMVADVLRKGGVVAYPTDTVYGFGCDIQDKKALERIYRVKRMPKDHPVSFVCPDLRDISRYAVVDDWAYRVMKRLLPGPYTFVLPATREVPRMVMRKQKTVGIRVPEHPITQALLAALGSPIISTSVSREGESFYDAEEIHRVFGREVDMVVDGGERGLVPSTIVDLSGGTAQVLREGLGPVDAI